MMHVDFNFRRQPSRQTRGLSPELRILIDMAVKAGRVEKIAPGVSALPGYIWCDKTHRLICADQLTPEEIRARKRGALENGQRRANELRTRAHLERKASAAATRLDGKTGAEIAEALGLTEHRSR